MSESPHPYRHDRPSLVWPILLIGAGVIFLLANLDLLPANTWLLIARLWPIALILIGLDILLGRRSTAGMVISALIALSLVAGLIAFLLLAPSIPILGRLTQPGDVQTQSIQAPLGGNQTASVDIDWTSGTNRLSALDADSANLIEGQVEYYGSLVFDVNNRESHADVILDSQGDAVNFFTFNFRSQDWTVALHPAVIYDLVFDTGSGQNEFDLSKLKLSDFSLDSGSGSINLSLPPGDYRAGIDGGSGSISITLPESAGVRVELNSGSGSFNSGSTLELVQGDRNDDGTWETPGFEQANQKIILEIDQGSGSIRIND